jgi:hypothetical protein
MLYFTEPADLFSCDNRPYFSKTIIRITHASQQTNFPHWTIFPKKSDYQEIISVVLNRELPYCVYKSLPLFSVQSAHRNISVHNFTGDRRSLTDPQQTNT